MREWRGAAENVSTENTENTEKQGEFGLFRFSGRVSPDLAKRVR